MGGTENIQNNDEINKYQIAVLKICNVTLMNKCVCLFS